MGFPDPFNLARFITAQQQTRQGYETALTEIRAGAKKSHWIWYILPPLAALGTSERSKRYGITSLAEAEAYLTHPVLRARLVEISQAVLDSRTRAVKRLMGSAVDVVKLQACMTLFLRADPDGEVFDFQAVLDKFFMGLHRRRLMMSWGLRVDVLGIAF